MNQQLAQQTADIIEKTKVTAKPASVSTATAAVPTNTAASTTAVSDPAEASATSAADPTPAASNVAEMDADFALALKMQVANSENLIFCCVIMHMGHGDYSLVQCTVHWVIVMYFTLLKYIHTSMHRWSGPSKIKDNHAG